MRDPIELQARLRRLADLLPAFVAERAATEGAATLGAATLGAATFGSWVASRHTESGAWTMPYVDYGPLAAEFRAATAGWVRPDIDWTTWAQTEDARALERDPARLARATPDELACLLTTLVRGDRFNEGVLLDAFRTGLLSRIARRASALAADPGSRTEP